MNTDYNDPRYLLRKIREAKEAPEVRQEYVPAINGIILPGKGILSEGEKKIRSIAITDDPRFGQNVLTSQINHFRVSVESGAKFSSANEDNVAESPLIYLPESGNLIFSGVIPCLNNLKWQFVLKTSTGNGCFLWCDGLILNRDNMQILNKLQGYYLNWREEWNQEAADLEKMVANMED